MNRALDIAALGLGLLVFVVVVPAVKLTGKGPGVLPPATGAAGRAALQQHQVPDDGAERGVAWAADQWGTRVGPRTHPSADGRRVSPANGERRMDRGRLGFVQQIQEDEYYFPYHYIDLFPKCVNWCLMQQSCRKAVRAALGNAGGRRLLDAGCGDGRLCFDLAREGWNVTGVDYSERAIAYAWAFCPEVALVVRDLASYWPDTQFDAITCMEVLEHIPPTALPNVVRNLSRCLRDGGILVVTVPSTNLQVSSKHYQHFSREMLGQALSPYFLIEKASGHIRTGWKRDLCRLLLRAGVFLTPLADKPVSQPFFALVRRLLESVEDCPPETGERIIAVCRKADAQDTSLGQSWRAT